MASERGFTMTEALLSMTIWGMLIVPFMIYYGTMQRAMYTSRSHLGVLHVSRATMDQITDDLRHIDPPTGSQPQPVQSAGLNGICFAFTPHTADDINGFIDPPAQQYMSYRWVGTSTPKQLLTARSSDISICSPPSTAEQPVPTAGFNAAIYNVQFSYYDSSGQLLCGPARPACDLLTVSPTNFARIAISISYRAQPPQPLPESVPDSLAYTLTTSVSPRNLQN